MVYAGSGAREARGPATGTTPSPACFWRVVRAQIQIGIAPYGPGCSRPATAREVLPDFPIKITDAIHSRLGDLQRGLRTAAMCIALKGVLVYGHGFVLPPSFRSWCQRTARAARMSPTHGVSSSRSGRRVTTAPQYASVWRFRPTGNSATWSTTLLRPCSRPRCPSSLWTTSAVRPKESLLVHHGPRTGPSPLIVNLRDAEGNP